jgi:kynurenine formamidase
VEIDLGTLVDLSYPIRSGMPVSSKDRPVSITRRMTHKEDGFCASSIEMGSHSGTHIDAPLHFFETGVSVDQLPLSRLIGTGCVLDFRDSPKAIGAAELSHAVTRCGGLAPGMFVVLWTGWDVPAETRSPQDHPFLTREAAEVLLTLQVSLVAIDALGVDDSLAYEFPAHSLLLGAGVPIVENVRNLHLLGEGHFGFAFIPLALADGDAAPIRAFAWSTPC